MVPHSANYAMISRYGASKGWCTHLRVCVIDRVPTGCDCLPRENTVAPSSMWSRKTCDLRMTRLKVLQRLRDVPIRENGRLWELFRGQGVRMTSKMCADRKCSRATHRWCQCLRFAFFTSCNSHCCWSVRVLRRSSLL